MGKWGRGWGVRGGGWGLGNIAPNGVWELGGGMGVDTGKGARKEQETHCATESVSSMVATNST